MHLSIAKILFARRNNRSTVRTERGLAMVDILSMVWLPIVVFVLILGVEKVKERREKSRNKVNRSD
jgi:Na+/H+-dicarboxylate symporter